MAADEVNRLNKATLLPFFTHASKMELSSRLKYFDDLFPYADDFPGSLFLLASDSTTLACNSYAWKQIKLDSISELVGHTSLEVERTQGWPADILGRAIEDDIRVLQEGLSIHQETIIEDDLEKVLFCKKEAIYADNGAPIGIMGLSLPLKTRHQKIRWNKEKNQITIYLNQKHSAIFSMREFSILQEIINAKSPKEIAAKYFLSPKTVETYIMRIKHKLSCTKQREIIPMLVKYNVAQAILEYGNH